MNNPFHTLRGVLALWVMLGHMLLVERYGWVYNAGFASHTDFGPLGLLSILHFTAVDLFFMISGVVLTLAHGREFDAATTGRAIDRFYLHRLWRIWPLHVLTVLAIGVIHLKGIPHPISSGNEEQIFAHWEWTLGINLLLMNGWGIIPVASWNEPAWTLSVTFFLYVMFPNLMLLANRLPRKRLVLAAGIATLILLYALLRSFVELGSHSDGAGGLVRGFVFFTCGMLLALMRTPHLPRKWAIAAFALFCLAVPLWTYVHPFSLTLLHLCYPLLLLGLMSGHVQFVPAGLSRWLGSRSFAIFLTHYPVLLLIHHHMSTNLRAWNAQGGLMQIGGYIFVVGLCLLVADIAARLDSLLHRKH